MDVLADKVYNKRLYITVWQSTHTESEGEGGKEGEREGGFVTATTSQNWLQIHVISYLNSFVHRLCIRSAECWNSWGLALQCSALT